MDNNTLNNDEVAPKWYKKHKKALIIGGIVIVGTTAVITYVFLRKKMVSTAEIVDAVNAFSESEIADKLIERARPTSPVPVKPHFRKLPEGWHPSKDQLKLAESLGFKVPERCTFIPEHIRYNNLTDCA